MLVAPVFYLCQETGRSKLQPPHNDPRSSAWVRD